jgi:mRNA deadenylase 3'-5' endonuclease subunit Ccr4
MTLFKVASFNANSIRVRLEIILDWLAREQPDVLCLQETKVQDPDFPAVDFQKKGYEVIFRGQKSLYFLGLPDSQCLKKKNGLVHRLYFGYRCSGSKNAESPDRY